MLSRLLLYLSLLGLICNPTFGAFSSFGPAQSQCNNLVGDGDSITIGFETNDPFPATISTSLGSSSSNTAVDGIGWNRVGNTGGQNLIQRGPTFVDPLLSSLACSGLAPWLVAFAGTNDICVTGRTGAQTFTDFTTYLNARIAAGWLASHILAPTILPRASCTGPGTEAQNYNTSLIAGAGSTTYVVVRLDLDANMGCNGCQNNGLYFNAADLIHPTATGQQILANLICLQIKVSPARCPTY